MSDLPAFNLLDEKWIPVRFLDGRQDEIGLLAVFEQADTIAALAETSPPNLMALYRVLLAITHRALGCACGVWKDKDRARWYREGFPLNALRGYLEHWRERFWLFHPEHPFMQVAALATAEETRDKVKPWTQIAIGRACGDDPVLFDHSGDENPHGISYAQAAIHLFGYLQFVVGGRTLRISAASNDDNSDGAGPLVGVAAVLPCGATLQETICLALHKATQPEQEDLPAWEHPALQRSDLANGLSPYTGYNDRYTRLTRAVLLSFEPDKPIRTIRFAAGIKAGRDVNSTDPMISYKATTNGLFGLTFTEGRAFWRDLPSLVPNVDLSMSHGAQVINHAANLKNMLGQHATEQPLLIAGLASKKAKVNRWRIEMKILPTAFLIEPGLLSQLREELSFAESTYNRVVQFAIQMYAAIMSDPDHKDTWVRAAKMIEGGTAETAFFAEAERALPMLVQYIEHGDYDEAHKQWAGTLLKAAQAAWALLVNGLGSSPKALQAEARAWWGERKKQKFYSGFKNLLDSLQRTKYGDVLSEEV